MQLYTCVRVMNYSITIVLTSSFKVSSSNSSLFLHSVNEFVTQRRLNFLRVRLSLN